MPQLMPDLLNVRDDAASDASDNDTLVTAIDDELVNQLDVKDPINNQLYEECKAMGHEIRKKLHEWIPLRMETAKRLRIVAPELEKIRSNVCIARITGSSVAVAGGVAGIVGGVLTVATAGLAAPVVVAISGGVAAALGSVTSVVSQIVEKVMSGNEMKEAEAAIEEDTKTTSEIQQLIEKLAEACRQVTIDGLLSVDEKISFFLFHSEFEKAEVRSVVVDIFNITVPEAVLRVTSIVLSVGGLTTNAVCNGLRIANIARAAAEVADTAVSGARAAGAVASEGAGIAADVVSGAGNVATSAARTGLTTTARVVAGAGIVAGGIGIIFDVVDIVQASIALSKEGKTEGSEKLLDTARCLEENANILQEQLERATDWINGTGKLISRLKRFSFCDVTADSALSDMETYILQEITEQEPNAQVVRHLLNNVKLFYELIKSKMRLVKRIQRNGVERRSEDGSPDDDRSSLTDDNSSILDDGDSSVDSAVDIVVVARGSACGSWETGSSLVDHPGINDVVFYQPWNCALDAAAAQAVCRGSLQPSSRQFKHCIHYTLNQSKGYCQQKVFNHMTRAKQAKIPQICVEACAMENRDLRMVRRRVGEHEKFDDAENLPLRFILPYAVSTCDAQYFHRVPLSAVCQAVGAVCRMFSLTATIHVVCNLTGDSLDHVRQVKQYCHVISDIPDQRPTMTCTVQDADLSQFKDALRPFLNADG